MSKYKLKKNNIENFLNELREEYSVFAPIESDGTVAFQKLDDVKLPDISLKRTDRPPKEIFFPHTEVILSFDDKNAESGEYRGKPIAVFGLKSCDSKSLHILDNVFLDSSYTDTYWYKRRSNSLIFTIGCNNPLPSCFCNWFKCGPFDSTHSDVAVTDIEDSFILEPVSEQGTEYLAKSKYLEKAEEKDIKKAEALKEKAESDMPQPPDLKKLKEILDNNQNDKLWEELAAKCLGCGVCAFSCPTCYCFDIQDDSRRNKGKRVRIWDTCQEPLFTKEGSGHNPRPSQKGRTLQRFMHKLSYMIETQNNFGCVGCGRCVTLCPVNIDIRDFIKKVLQVKGDK
ncbi:MAG: 4Fe-4S dicluster domain-containing protein [Victivallales bacterium]|nr:4Fe-4S dicluster domain-containing protein [Victivallales bacterium]